MSYILRPNGTGDLGSDYTKLLSNDGDSTYITNTGQEGFPLDDLPGGVSGIIAIRVVFTARNSGASSTSGITPILLSGSQAIGSPDSAVYDTLPLTSAYTTVYMAFSYGCSWHGLTPWTVSDVNALYVSWSPEFSGAGLRVTEMYLEVLTTDDASDMYLFGESDSDGHTNVFSRNAVAGEWYLVSTANPSNLWFESIDTDYASGPPNGFSANGHLYSFTSKGWSSFGDYTIPRFNRSTRIIENGIDRDPGGTYHTSLGFNGWWAHDISGGSSAVAWSQPINSPSSAYIFHWDGSSGYFESSQNFFSDQWAYVAASLSDFTTMPKNLTHGTSGTQPSIYVDGLYIFQLNGYYWGVSYLQMNASGNAWYGVAIVRFENAGDPPDVPTRIGTASLRGVFAPHFPSLTVTVGEMLDFPNFKNPVWWGANIIIQMTMQNYYRTDAVGHPEFAADETTCLAIISSTGTVWPAMDWPSTDVLTYKYGAFAFYHKEGDTVYAWIKSGAGYYTSSVMTRINLYKLSAYDLTTGSFTWIPLAYLDVADASGFHGPVADADALYFAYSEYSGTGSIYDNQVIYRYDIAGDTWSTEPVLGMTGDEYWGTLVKLVAQITARRMMWGGVVG